MKKYTTLFLFLLSAINAFGQSGQEIDMADTLRKDGKIWVVVATIAVSFARLAIYLIRIDRKLKRMERIQKDDEQNKSVNYENQSIMIQDELRKQTTSAHQQLEKAVTRITPVF